MTHTERSSNPGFKIYEHNRLEYQSRYKKKDKDSTVNTTEYQSKIHPTVESQ